MTYRVISAQFVADRLGLGDLSEQATEVEDTINSNIDGACILVERLLNTKLSFQQDVVDLFHVNVALYWASLPDGLAPLRLSRAFFQTPSMEILSCPTLIKSMAAEGDAVTVSGVITDWEKGVVKIPTSSYDKKFIRVSYSAGFKDEEGGSGGSGGGRRVDPTVPEWLQEAVMAEVYRVMSQEQSTNRTVEDVAKGDQQRETAEDLLLPYSRFNIPFRFEPI